ncbi:MAG: MATE family efflux transporter [Gammaproteobacteria bacterium]|nr:MATE family efflux transporter [Gammaproteobacteria bacterium]
MPHSRPLQRKIWDIAWPAILSNISIPLLGLVDTAILGHLDNTRYLGAVAIGASILSFLYWGFSFLRMGTTGLVAKASGAGLRQRELEVLLQSAVLALLLAVLVILLHRYWLDLGLYLMDPGPSIAPLAKSYTYIRIYSAPVVLVTYAVVGWFIGRQNTRWPMVIVVITNIVNVLLDLLFIVVLDWKSDGAAYATLCAEYLGGAVAIYAVIHSLKYRPDGALLKRLREWRQYRELLASNRYLFVRTMCLLFSFAFFTAQSARFGEDQLAANAIMLNLLLLAAYAMDGFAYAAEALSGHAIGAGRLQEFYAAVKACWQWSLLSAVGLSAIFAAADQLLFPLFTDHEPVRYLLREHLLWLALMPLVAVTSYLLDGVFIGTAMTSYMMHSMLFSLLVVYLPAWYLLLPQGNDGLWLAFLLFNAARGISLGLCYWYLCHQGRWLQPTTS